MVTPRDEIQIQTWLENLASAESKRHEAAALAIAKTLTYNDQIIAALKRIAREDPQKYAREAAKNALYKIAEAHFAAGNDIRAYLEQLRVTEGRKLQATAAPVPVQPMASPVKAPPAVPIETKPQPQTVTLPIQAVETKPIAPAPAFTPAAPPKPQVPFDQWLLSERNIKLALYSGGFLLLLAGLIFVGINWTYLPGIAKLGVTLAVTLAMYAGGVLLFRRPSLKIGGTALLAIASGFLPLNFVVMHLYLTNQAGISAETMWLMASLGCGTVYMATALWSRQNLFTVFALIALLSGVTALMVLLELEYTAWALGYAVAALGVLLSGFAARQSARLQFTARTLCYGAHAAALPVFLMAMVAWVFASINSFHRDAAWSPLAAMLLMVVLYALDDWRSKSMYARWGAAVTLGVLAVLTCTQLQFSVIQTGFVLKILAAGYLVLGRFLQRGKKLQAGAPLYTVSALLAVLVTLQAASVYSKTPEHLALALTGDVALLCLATYLFRRVEFLYAAVWMLIAPVFIFVQEYIAVLVWRGLAMGALLLGYAVLGFWLAPKQKRRAMPMLTAAAFLSLVVPGMLYPNFAVLTAVLLLIAAGYAVMALRLQKNMLLFASVAAVDLAIVSGMRVFLPWDWNLARAVAFALGAWAVLLFYARKGLEFLRVKEWGVPLAVSALINFGLTYALLVFIAVNDQLTAGFISIQLALTLSWGVAFLALTAYLYRRVEFVYAATWLGIVPVYIFAKLYLGNETQVGLALGALMLVYAAVGYWIGRARLLRSGAFLSAAAGLSVIVVAVLYPNFIAMTAVLVGIAALYTFYAVWLRWHWLVLAALVALNGALFSGIWNTFTATLDFQRAVSIGFAALGLALVAGGVELKRRGWSAWRAPLNLVACIDLLVAYLVSLNAGDLIVVALSVVFAVIALAMQWVERAGFGKWNFPPLLSYAGTLVLLNGIYFATRMLNLDNAYVVCALAFSGALYVAVALLLRHGEWASLYGSPLRYVGLVTLGGALLLVTVLNTPLAAALAFAVAAVAFGADGFVRKQIALVYAGGAMLLAAWAWTMRWYGVTEWQAYTIPLGVYGLAVGWSEARLGRLILYQFATIAGLAVLMGSAFYQSLTNVNYAALLLVESALAFAYGLKTRSRMYVEAGILALLANGIAQFGPAFVQLERWVQIGTIGSILVLGGLVALFRRQKLLETRRTLTSEWKMWKP